MEIRDAHGGLSNWLFLVSIGLAVPAQFFGGEPIFTRLRFALLTLALWLFPAIVRVWLRIDGSAGVTDLSPDYKVILKQGGRSVDVFGKDRGTNPDNVKNPEG